MYFYNVNYSEKMGEFYYRGVHQFGSAINSTERYNKAIELAQELAEKDNFRNVTVEEVLPGTACVSVVWPK